MATAKDDEKILETAKNRYKEAIDYYSDEYKRGREDLDFALGNQWPDEIKRQREAQSRPCLTENRCLTFLHQVINDIRQARPAINIIPVDDQTDPEKAKVMRGIVRSIETSSGADNVYDTGAWNAIASGYGWLRVNTKYCDDKTFDQEIELLRVPDFASVVLDPNSKELDGSDAEYGFVIVSMSRDKFKSEYPDADPVEFETNSKSGMCSEDTIDVCEYFYKEYTKETIRNGNMTRIVRVPQVKWCKITASEILEQTDWLGKYIPLVPVFGEEIWQDGRRKSYSLVTQAKDPQRRYNYWLTASTEIIALQPKAPFVGLKGQFATNGDKWARANTETYSYLEYDPVKLADGTIYANAPQRQPAPMGSPAMFQEMMAAADGIKATLGIFDASLGVQSNETSGKAIQARQAEGDNATFHFVDNLQTSIRHVGRILVDLIPKVYNTPKVMMIIGEDDSKQMVAINQASVKAKNGYMPVQAGQQPDAFFDLNVGKYDVVATVGASYQTKRQETVAVLQSIIQALPESAAIVGDILIKNLDIAEADLIVERMKKLNPALAEDGQDQNAQALMEAQQAMQQMQAQLVQMDEALKAKKTKDDAETQAEIQKTQAEIEKIKAETMKIQTEAATAASQSVGITPEAIQEIVRTIATLEAATQDTAQAVDLILSHYEQDQETLPPEQSAMLPEMETQDDRD